MGESDLYIDFGGGLVALDMVGVLESMTTRP